MVSDLSQEQIDYAPSPEKWSIGQVLDHLILADGFYRGEILKLIELARAGERPVLNRSFKDVDVTIAAIPKSLLSLMELPLTITSSFAPRALIGALTEFRVLPARSPRALTPCPRRDGQDLRRELASSLEELEDLLENNSDLDYDRMRHSHPLMGVNNIPSMVQIVARHERRHQYQIQDILQSSGFPVNRANP